MKALKFIIIGMILFFTGAVQAQISVSVTIGSPPPWGPSGYNDVRYYYLPDVEAYYDVHSSVFIYYVGGKWVHRANLPIRYRSYNLYDGYKVVMTDYHGDSPYTHFPEYKTKYARGYHGDSQKTIGERPGNGNNKAEIHSKDNSNKMGNQGNNRIVGNGNDKNMKKGQSKSGGNRKKK